MPGLIRDKSHFYKGILLLASFFIIFFFLLRPVFTGEEGRRLSGLQYADEVFNELSKGSSWFIPEIMESVKSLDNAGVDLNVALKNPELLSLAGELLRDCGASAEISADRIAFKGDLGAILQRAAEDSALLYNNDGNALSAKYGGEAPLKIARAWWQLLHPCVKALQRQGKLAEAKIVDQVLTKAIEPGNNFYGLEAAKMSEHVPLVCGLLIFYIGYTLWYGFGLYNIFIGLGMLGAGAKKK